MTSNSFDWVEKRVLRLCRSATPNSYSHLYIATICTRTQFTSPPVVWRCDHRSHVTLQDPNSVGNMNFAARSLAREMSDAISKSTLSLYNNYPGTKLCSFGSPKRYFWQKATSCAFQVLEVALQVSMTWCLAWMTVGYATVCSPGDWMEILSRTQPVRACAEYYLRTVQRRLIGEPIHLLGYSLGGWIALEIAHQLRERGCDIGSLTLIDSSPPDDNVLAVREYTYPETLIEWLRVAQVYYGRTVSLRLQDFECLTQAKQRELLHKRLVGVGALPKNSGAEQLFGPLASFATRLLTCYSTRFFYTQKVSLMLAMTDIYGVEYDQDELMTTMRKWKRWIPQVGVSVVRANHITHT